MVADIGWAAKKVTDTIRHVIADDPLDDDLALRHARALIVQPLTGVSAEEAYAALDEALGSGACLSTWRDDPRAERPIDEGDFRQHLARVMRHMDSMRPWSVPLFRPLDPTVEWARFSPVREVGVLRLRVPKVEDRLHVHLLPLDRSGGPGLLRVAVLRLRSGHDVALVGRWWPDTPNAVAVLSDDPDVSASELMVELTSGDHFEQGEYEVLG